MNTTALLVVLVLLLPALGVAAWAWFTMLRVERELRFDAGYENTDLEIGTWPASTAAK